MSAAASSLPGLSFATKTTRSTPSILRKLDAERSSEVGSLVALELALGTGRAVDPDLRRLIGREVGPPARSVVSTSNLIALNADERNFNNRIRHESQTKTMRGPSA